MTDFYAAKASERVQQREREMRGDVSDVSDGELRNSIMGIKKGITAK